MASSNDLFVICPDQRQVRETGRSNSDDSRVTVCTWVCDIDGRIVACNKRRVRKYLNLMIETRKCHLPAKAKTSPEGEKATLWTQPPRLLWNSPHTVLKGSLSPQTVGGGFLSTPLIKAENTRAFMSAEPEASRTLLGCQSTERTVLRIGFLMCLLPHQSLSSSK